MAYVGAKKVTLVEIAKRLGVSTSTISRALNDSVEISAEMKQKVLEAAHEMNYTPNDLARSLVTHKSHTMAAIIPDVMNPYYSELICGIERIVRQNDFALLLCITNENDLLVDYYLNELLKKRVSGILLLSTFVKNSALFEKVKANTAVVGISTCHDDIDQISINEGQGTYSVIRHLLSLGHRRIAFLGYRLFDNRVLSYRLDGYKKALTEAGIPIDEALIMDADPIGNPGKVGMEKLLAQGNLPTAVHCMNEYIALGAYASICDAKLQIPRDISLSAHDGLEISRAIQPSLTTVKTPITAMGEAAVELILQRIKSTEKKEKQLVLFDSQVYFGQSTSAP